jgi:protein-histidine pros-kinase
MGQETGGTYGRPETVEVTVGLRTKFNLVLIAAFLVGLAVATWLAWQSTTEQAQRQMLIEANLIMGSGTAVRGYTQKEIEPLVADQLATRFVPHSVPSFAAQAVLRQLAKEYPDYSYKEAALNPTNPSDRATTWEADVIDAFKRDPKLTEFVGTRDTPIGPFLTFAHPFRLTDKACLACHSTPAAAPASMIDLYGKANGFGWQLGDVIGAQIVSVPMSVALRRAHQSLLAFMGSLSALFLVTLILLNVLLHYVIIKPIQRITGLAGDVVAGKPNVPEFPVKGRDEIASLGRSFNLMHRSLQNAFRMLEKTT